MLPKFGSDPLDDRDDIKEAIHTRDLLQNIQTGNSYFPL